MATQHDAALLAGLAAQLREVRDEPPMTARRIAEGALEVVPEAAHASITVRRRRGQFASLGATSDLAVQADEAQYALREGPCVEATESADFLRSGDVEHDERWPSWGPRAATLGLRSLLSVRLWAQGEPIGALNLYAGETGRFADRDVVDLAALYATHAALALAAVEQLNGLETAMTSRHIIGLAQGIFMERYGLEADQAFALLQRMSSTSNVTLREVAAQVVAQRTDAAAHAVPHPEDAQT
jgi:GAF domain-containing protein